MNKIKVIELLNKIANGEEVPKKVMDEEKEWVYSEEFQDYIYIRDDLSNYFLLQEIFSKCIETKKILLYEIKVVEEDKEIKILDISDRREREDCTPLIVEIMAKLNEVIGVVNKLNKKN